MRISPYCRGCCTYRDPEFGDCDGGMIRGAIFDEDTHSWEPTDWTCRGCDGTGHTAECLAQHEAHWEAFYAEEVSE